MKQSKSYRVCSNMCSIFLVFVMLFPIYIMVLGSFRPGREIFSFQLLPTLKDMTLDGYKTLFAEKNFFRSYANTLFSSVVITLVALLFATMAGFALAKLNFPGRKFAFFYIISTMMVPFSLLMLPLFMLIQNMNMMDTIWGVIIPSLPRAYGVFLIRQFMRSIPNDLIEASKIDGCGYARIFTRVVMPLSKPVIFTLATTIFLTSWNNYTWPLIAIQSREKRLLQVYVASFFQENLTRWDLVFAALCLSTIPTIILFFVSQRFLVDGIKMSGIKE